MGIRVTISSGFLPVLHCLRGDAFASNFYPCNVVSGVFAAATWLAGWLGGWLSVTAGVRIFWPTLYFGEVQGWGLGQFVAGHR